MAENTPPSETPPEPSAATHQKRLRVALILFVLNYLTGWPVVALSGGASPWIGVELAATIGSASYAFSWVLLGAAIAIGGREITVYGKEWLRTRLRR